MWKVHFVFVLSEQFESRMLLSTELHNFGDAKGIAALKNSDKGALVGVALESIDEDTPISEILAGIFNCKPGQDATVSYTLRRLRSRLESLLCLVLKIPSSAEQPEYTEVPIRLICCRINYHVSVLISSQVPLTCTIKESLQGLIEI